MVCDSKKYAKMILGTSNIRKKYNQSARMCFNYCILILMFSCSGRGWVSKKRPHRSIHRLTSFFLCSTRPRGRTLGVRKPPDSKACVFSLEAKREEKGATLVEVGSLLVPSRLAESYKLFIRHFNACLD